MNQSSQILAQTLMMACYTMVVGADALLVMHAIIGITNDPQRGNCGVRLFEGKAIKMIEREKGATLGKVHEFRKCAC